MKIWKGPSGYNPELGRVDTGQEVNIPIELEAKYKGFYKEKEEKKPEAKKTKTKEQ